MHATRLWLLLSTLVFSGCEPPGTPHIIDLIDPTATYLVRLSGRDTAPTGAFTFSISNISEHRLRAEIFKQKSPYVPARIIYIADSMDTAFKERYGAPEWVTANVLRFPSNWGRHEGKSDLLRVENHSEGLIRALRINTAQDMFMIFDLRPASETILRMGGTIPSADLNWFHVVAEWGDTARPSEAGASFSLRGGRQARYEFVISIGPERIEFAETRGPWERYR